MNHENSIYNDDDDLPQNVVGVISVFNNTKGYGYINPKIDWPKIFIHKSQLIDDTIHLCINEQVSFDIGLDKYGRYQATNVKLTPNQPYLKFYNGEILWYSVENKYGFITPNTSNNNNNMDSVNNCNDNNNNNINGKITKDIFFHGNQAYKNPKTKDKVQFQLDYDRSKNRYRAIKIIKSKIYGNIIKKLNDHGIIKVIKNNYDGNDDKSGNNNNSNDNNDKIYFYKSENEKEWDSLVIGLNVSFSILNDHAINIKKGNLNKIYYGYIKFFNENNCQNYGFISFDNEYNNNLSNNEYNNNNSNDIYFNQKHVIGNIKKGDYVSFQIRQSNANNSKFAVNVKLHYKAKKVQIKQRPKQIKSRELHTNKYNSNNNSNNNITNNVKIKTNQNRNVWKSDNINISENTEFDARNFLIVIQEWRDTMINNQRNKTNVNNFVYNSDNSDNNSVDQWSTDESGKSQIIF